MISKPTKILVRELLAVMQQPYSPFELTLLRMEASETMQAKLELESLLKDPPPEEKPKALVKFEAPDWEYMDLRAFPTNEAPAVRRLYVVGGHIYQVAFESNTGKWHPPIFVPDPQQQITAQQIEELIAAARRV